MRICGRSNGEVTKALRRSRPGKRPRTSGRAAAVPITVEASAVHTASSAESQRACMNSRRWKKLANHFSEKPWGGKVK